MASVAAAAPEEEPGKDKGGRPPNEPSVSKEELAALALELPVRRLSKKTGISDNDCRIIKRITDMTVEEFQEDQRTKLQEMQDMALQQAKATIGKASALQAATVMGICADKLSNQPKSVTQNLHVHLKESDREDFLASLLGRQKERQASVSSHHDQMTKDDSKAKPAGPVIDLDPPGSTGTDTLSADKPRK
jgi:hypothetical protein